MEQYYSLSPCQRALFQGVIEVPRDSMDVALYELSDTVVDTHPRADGCHLVGHLCQVAGPDTSGGLHLGSRLHLKNPHCVGLVDGAVDVLVLEVDAR